MAALKDQLQNFLQKLNSEDKDEQLQALYTLSTIEERLPEVISSLTKLLWNENWEVRDASIYAIARVCNKTLTADVIFNLLALYVRNVDPCTRGAILFALKKTELDISPTSLDFLPFFLVYDYTLERYISFHRILETHFNLPMHPQLVDSLVSAVDRTSTVFLENNSITQNCGTLLLLSIGERATSPMLSRLTSYLKHSNSVVRRVITRTFAYIGEKARTPEVWKSLINGLGDENQFVGHESWFALQLIGGEVALKELMSNITPENPIDIRKNATNAIKIISNNISSFEALAPLCENLFDPNEDLFRVTVAALKTLKQPLPQNISNRVISILNSPQPEVAITIFRALETPILSNETLEAFLSKLTQFLTSENLNIRKKTTLSITEGYKKLMKEEWVEIVCANIAIEDDELTQLSINFMWRHCALASEKCIEMIIGYLDNERIRERVTYLLSGIGIKAATPKVMDILSKRTDKASLFCFKDLQELLQKLEENKVKSDLRVIIVEHRSIPNSPS